jgi:hypothetical protein
MRIAFTVKQLKSVGLHLSGSGEGQVVRSCEMVVYLLVPQKAGIVSSVAHQELSFIALAGSTL